MNNNDLRRLERMLLGSSVGDIAGAWEFLGSERQPIEIALLYGKVFWPDLVEVDGFVLLTAQYDEDYYHRVLADLGRDKLEATINTTYLRTVFGDRDAHEAVWETLGCLLSHSWKACAETKFPGRKFHSEFSWYSDIGDPGITLFQVSPRSRS